MEITCQPYVLDKVWFSLSAKSAAINLSPFSLTPLERPVDLAKKKPWSRVEAAGNDIRFVHHLFCPKKCYRTLKHSGNDIWSGVFYTKFP